MDWLKLEIARGFQRLICLCLDRQPTDDLIEGTERVWFDAFMVSGAWEQELDTWRFQKAFVLFSATPSDAWPQPYAILALLPERITATALPRSVITDEQRLDNLRRLDEIRSSLGSAL